MALNHRLYYLKTIVISAFCLLGFISKSNGQANLTIESLTNFQDTVTAPTINIFQATVKNTGTLAYSGALVLRYDVRDAITATVWSSYTVNAGNVVINPGQTQVITINDSINGNTYKGGNSVVVIWPINYSTNKYTKPRVVLGLPQGLLELSTYLKDIKVYPNPFKNEINYPENNFKDVTVYNQLGAKFLYHKSNNRLTLPTDIATGSYYLLFTGTDGNSYYLNMVKE